MLYFWSQKKELCIQMHWFISTTNAVLRYVYVMSYQKERTMLKMYKHYCILTYLKMLVSVLAYIYIWVAEKSVQFNRHGEMNKINSELEKLNFFYFSNQHGLIESGNASFLLLYVNNGSQWLNSTLLPPTGNCARIRLRTFDAVTRVLEDFFRSIQLKR